MCDTGYSIKRLVADLRELRHRSTTETQMLEVVPDLARRMVLSKHTWLRPAMCAPNAAALITHAASRHVTRI